MLWLSIISSINIIMAAEHIYHQRIQTKYTTKDASVKEDYPCAEGLCTCNGILAYCQGLRYVPKLPNNTKSLFFGFSYLPAISAMTFYNISNLKLEVLTLGNNHVEKLANDAFVDFNFLQAFFFEQEIGLNPAELTNAISNMKALNMHRIKLFNNRLQTVDFKIFSGFENLSDINLARNNLREVVLAALHNVKCLDFRENLIINIPNFCANKSQKSYFPTLTELDLSYNKIFFLGEETFQCLPALTSLRLNGNPLSTIDNNFISSLRMLYFLDVSRITSTNTIVFYYAFNSSSLTRLKLERIDSLKFLYLPVPFYMYINCPNLTHLSLSNTPLPNDETKLNALLSYKTQIQNLDLSFTGLAILPEVTFLHMTSLKYLDLKGNKLRSWNGSKTFQNSKIISLSMKANQISVLNSTSFPSTMLKYLNKLDLSENPFLCSCQALESINWIHKHADTLLNYPDGYNCSLPPEMRDIRLVDYNPSAESCAEKNIPLLVSVPVSVIAVTTMSVIFLVYKCRWRLRYGIFLFNNRYKKYDRLADSYGFEYAGFVIYSDADRNWVHNELLHRLEDQEGFRLCIRLRDFAVGKVHVDNIVDNMSVSEKIMVILSNNFARDEWCDFQLLLAETRLLKQNTDMLVIFMLEEINSDCLRASLYKLVTERQFALWSDDETGKDLFWKQVVSQMKKSTAKDYGTMS